ncbi:hypothetical protein CRYUN_Cryun38cG0070300 [Craigia yunnanensis]
MGQILAHCTKTSRIRSFQFPNPNLKSQFLLFSSQKPNRRICCNRGPSANLFHLTLVITATVCCWMMWAIVYLAQMKPLIVPILSEGE